MIPSKGYAAKSPTDILAPFDFERREVGLSDVKFDILFCGVCHSDLHTVRNEWGRTQYPIVPGHEIVGRVAEVGANVTKFKKGDLIIYPKYSGHPIKVDGDEFLILDSKEILAILKEEK